MGTKDRQPGEWEDLNTGLKIHIDIKAFSANRHTNTQKHTYVCPHVYTHMYVYTHIHMLERRGKEDGLRTPNIY